MLTSPQKGWMIVNVPRTSWWNISLAWLFDGACRVWHTQIRYIFQCCIGKVSNTCANKKWSSVTVIQMGFPID